MTKEGTWAAGARLRRSLVLGARLLLGAGQLVAVHLLRVQALHRRHARARHHLRSIRSAASCFIRTYGT